MRKSKLKFIDSFCPLQLPLIKTKEELNNCIYSKRDGFDFFSKLLGVLVHQLNYCRRKEAIKGWNLPIEHRGLRLGRVYFVVPAQYNAVTDIYWDFEDSGDYLIKCDDVFSAENKMTELANKNSPAHKYESDWEKLVYSFAESITVNCELFQSPTTNYAQPQKNPSLQQTADLQHAEAMRQFDELIKSLKRD